MRKRIGNRWVVLVVFGALFAALFAIVGVATGIGHPSVPSGAVAVVDDAPDGTITTAAFQDALKQAAARQGLPPKAPSPSNPQYSALRDTAMSTVLISRWIRGEAEERGITVSDTEISNQLKQFEKQVGTHKQFQQYIKKVGFTPQEARDQVELSLLGSQVQQQVTPQTSTVSETQISDYYEANKSQFSQPESRDVRQIVNKDKAKVEQAKSQLEKDNSSKSWKQVAKKYSTDKATNGNGGLRQGVTKGQSDPTLDSQIFSAAQGALVGPFKAGSGYYLIQVDKVTPATTTPLSKISSQIKQQLGQGQQQEALARFQTDFISKWTQRTFCANGYVVDRCANFVPPDACNGDDSGETGNLDKSGCAAFVPSTAPVAPGSATVFPGQAAQGAPQGPQSGAAAAQPGVIGPSGAPQLPPGAAPQGTAPPTAPSGG